MAKIIDGKLISQQIKDELKEQVAAMKEKGILIRHFTADRIKDYNRITIGTAEQMETFIAGVRECLEEKA